MPQKKEREEKKKEKIKHLVQSQTCSIIDFYCRETRGLLIYQRIFKIKNGI